MVEEHIATPFIPAEEMVIDDLETLRVLADPLRLNIIEYLTKPSTVKRIAEKLNKPPTKLYYHFNLLEKHQLITLVDTRVVSGIIEKHYQASAKSYRLERGLLSPANDEPGHELDLTLTSLFTDSKNDMLESLRAGVMRLESDISDPMRLNFRNHHLILREDEAREFTLKWRALQDEFGKLSELNADDPEAQLYKLFWIMFPSARAADDQT